LTPIDFSQRVAIVTGAGAGIGRAIALLLAQRGARVLVNDYGGDSTGQGGGPDAAAAVAEEICRAGGSAVAQTSAVGSAEAAQAIVDAALQAFGRVDILINNAGISAPGAIDSVPVADIERVLRVNLHGPYFLTRAVWPLLRAQRYGRILNISSNAALGIGSSTAYATAKAGLIGLTKDTAQEGAPFGICVNALMPVAYTRMTARIPDPIFREWMQTNFPPSAVATVAAYLVGAGVAVNGEIIGAGGGRASRIAFFGTHGFFADDLTPEDVAAQCARICDPAGGSVLRNNTEELHSYLQWLPWPEGKPLVAMRSVQAPESDE
jgi:NAD(P)-dependent dehydrogenase (short-subunit alcohol dehydrogenase family)